MPSLGFLGSIALTNPESSAVINKLLAPDFQSCKSQTAESVLEIRVQAL